MKEPDEVKNMQQMIHQLYQKKKQAMQTTQTTQTTPQVKHNYKNIDVLPTVYDEVDSPEMDSPQYGGENIQEGFIMDKLQRKKWKAPYVGPPKEGPIKDIKHHPADKFHNILLKGESLMKYMLDNEEYIDDVLGTRKKEKKKNTKFQLKSLLTPFGDCPCIMWPKKMKNIKAWFNFLQSILAFFTDYIPCLIEGYCKLIVGNFTTENDYEFSSTKEKQDTNNVKGLVVEFLYILVAGYLSMILFYYTTMNSNCFMEFSGLSSSEDVERLLGYWGFPTMIFNKVFRDYIPSISSLLGFAPYAKLNYIFMFMVSIAIIFNGGMSLWVDLAKDALKFKGHAIIYGMVLIAILMKMFDMSSYTEEYINRMNSFSVWILEFIRVASIIFIAIMATPISQMLLVGYVFWLFFILPLIVLPMGWLKGQNSLFPLNEVSEYIFDPQNDSSCDVPTELFFGVLAQLIAKYIFPIMFPLVLLIFFGYRLYLSQSIHSSSLRLIMLIIHLCILVVIAFYLFILWVRSSKSLENTVHLESEIDSVGSNPVNDSVNNEKFSQISDPVNSSINPTSAIAPIIPEEINRDLYPLPETKLNT